jgi:hypothetical protein
MTRQFKKEVDLRFLPPIRAVFLSSHPWVSRAIIFLALLFVYSPPSFADGDTCSVLILCPKNQANVETVVRECFALEEASEEVRGQVDWIVTSGDNQKLPFLVVDKKRTLIFAYNKDGKILGSSPVLLGSAIGDVSIPGTGSKELSQILPEECITPAGRFYARLGNNSNGKEVLWIDFDMALAIHPVPDGRSKERRLLSLFSESSKEHRVSLGCVNVPKEFYTSLISPLFSKECGLVYVFPETFQCDSIFEL